MYICIIHLTTKMKNKPLRIHDRSPFFRHAYIQLEIAHSHRVVTLYLEYCEFNSVV